MKLPSRRELRERVIQRDGASCLWCSTALGVDHPDVTLDHVLPQVRGGSWALDNLVLACSACNSARAHSDPLQWAARCRDQSYRIQVAALARAITRADSELAHQDYYRLAVRELQLEGRARRLLGGPRPASRARTQATRPRRGSYQRARQHQHRTVHAQERALHHRQLVQGLKVGPLPPALQGRRERYLQRQLRGEQGRRLIQGEIQGPLTRNLQLRRAAWQGRQQRAAYLRELLQGEIQGPLTRSMSRRRRSPEAAGGKLSGATRDLSGAAVRTGGGHSSRG